MLRLLTRFLGLILLAGGFISLIVDGTRSIAGGRLLMTPIRRALAEMFPALYAQLQAGVESVASFLWDPLLMTLMLAPLSLMLGGLGAGLILLTEKRARPIGYAAR